LIFDKGTHYFISVPGSRSDAYDVHFDVEEKNLLKGGLQTQFDANSANMVDFFCLFYIPKIC